MKADSITDDKNTIQKEEKAEEQKRALNEEDVKKLKSYVRHARRSLTSISL